MAVGTGNRKALILRAPEMVPPAHFWPGDPTGEWRATAQAMVPPVLMPLTVGDSWKFTRGMGHGSFVTR
jgi:hypothetical protein